MVDYMPRPCTFQGERPWVQDDVCPHRLFSLPHSTPRLRTIVSDSPMAHWRFDSADWPSETPSPRRKTSRPSSRPIPSCYVLQRSVDRGRWPRGMNARQRRVSQKSPTQCPVRSPAAPPGDHEGWGNSQCFAQCLGGSRHNQSRSLLSRKQPQQATVWQALWSSRGPSTGLERPDFRDELGESNRHNPSE